MLIRKANCPKFSSAACVVSGSDLQEGNFGALFVLTELASQQGSFLKSWLLH